MTLTGPTSALQRLGPIFSILLTRPSYLGRDLPTTGRGATVGAHKFKLFYKALPKKKNFQFF
jgi:hypothetical protein